MLNDNVFLSDDKSNSIATVSPFVNTLWQGLFTQVWYDDPQSLRWKYQYAKSMNLRGIGPFQFGDARGGNLMHLFVD